MPVKFYEWGLLKGGANVDGTPISPVGGGGGGGGGGVSGAPEQYTGTLAAATTTIAFTDTTVGVSIRNTSDSDALEYSFDNATWFIALSYQVIQEGAQVDLLYLRAVSGSPTFEVTGLISA